MLLLLYDGALAVPALIRCGVLGMTPNAVPACCHNEIARADPSKGIAASAESSANVVRKAPR